MKDDKEKALEAIRKTKQLLAKMVVVGDGPHGYWDCEKDCFVPFEKESPRGK